MTIAIWQHRDGEMRIIEHGNAGTTYYLEMLFTDANLTGPIARGRTEEILCTDRGNVDSNASYRQAPNATRLEPVPMSFSCKTANTPNTQAMIELLSGVTTIRGHTMYSRKGKGIPIPQIGVALPTFADSGKQAYMVEVKWAGSGVSDFGIRWDEVYFPPNEQTVTEAEDSVTFNVAGQIYGGVTKITSFTTATNLATN